MHRSLNVRDKLPKRLNAEAKATIREIYEAPTRAECCRRRAEYCTKVRATGHEDAADCLERAWEDFTAFYDFPEEHWTHLRTSNPVESIFAGVRLRPNSTKRLRSRENALYLVFTLVLRLSTNWRPINGRNQLALLLDGEHFDDGRLRRTPTTMEGTGA